MQEQAVRFISEDEYLEQERVSSMKYEYFQGEVFAMAGASRKHNLIVSNVITSLVTQLRKKPCRVYPSDLRLKISETGLYTYPDVMVVCGEEIFSDDKEDMLLNPDVIIEVLSESTEQYDRTTKFNHYRTLKSLKEYVLISQTEKKIETHFKIEDHKWLFTETGDHSGIIKLESIGCELRHDEIYDKVD